MERVLITGANRGIGLEFVRQCLARGDTVLAGARRPDEARELDELERRFGEMLHILPLDVTDDTSIAGAHRSALTRVDGLDLLVNNAGINEGSHDAGGRRLYVRLGSLSAPDMLRVLHVNTVGPLMVAQAFLELLRRGRRPRIAGISSGLGSITHAGGGGYAYNMSKAALNMATRMLSIDLRSEDIVSVAFSPGWVRTDMGGSQAPLAPAESVAGMLRVIDGLTMEQTGEFLSWKDGKRLEW
jgi:NAD(P)-dependent dehydrogenase (short-subunit alcohol dehydrogenase family)